MEHFCQQSVRAHFDVRQMDSNHPGPTITVQTSKQFLTFSGLENSRAKPYEQTI